MTASPQLLETPEPHGHFVQLHDNDTSLLARNVARYFAEGLRRNECALAIATPEHTEEFVAELASLGLDPAQAVRDSKLLFLDAVQTLGEFMIDGQPNWPRFRKVVAAARSRLGSAHPTGLRTYGEMVGVLWNAGQYTAAIRLEEFWNKLLDDADLTLFCSYPIDIFAKDFQVSAVDALLCDHTHLIPTGNNDQVANAIHRAMHARLGPRAQQVKERIDSNHGYSWAVLPRAEALILWLRTNMPVEAEKILALAREYYRGPFSKDKAVAV